MLKMCISKHCHEVTGFLSWFGTYCISYVVQQRSRVKDLSLLVGYDESWLGEIRLVKSIKGIQPLVEEFVKLNKVSYIVKSYNMKCTLYYAHAKLKAVKGKRLRRNIH